MSLNDQALAAYMEHLDEKPSGIECYYADSCLGNAEYALITHNAQHNSAYTTTTEIKLCQDCAIEALKDMKPNQEIVKI